MLRQLFLSLSVVALAAAGSAQTKPSKPEAQWVPPGTPGSKIDGTIFHAQVLLGAAGFSTGVIDGKDGMVVKAAIRGFQQSQGIEATGELDPGTRRALLQSNRSSTVTVRLSQSDLSGQLLLRPISAACFGVFDSRINPSYGVSANFWAWK